MRHIHYIYIKYKFKFIFSIAAAASLLFTGCASLLPSSDEATASEPSVSIFTQSKPAAAEPAETRDPNIPDFVVDTTAAPDEPEPPQSSPETAEAVETEEIPQQSDISGEIVDDWRAGLNIEYPADVEELFQRFSIDKNTREGYYRMISSECQLPVIHISTENEQEILSREDYVNCLVEIMNCAEVYKLAATAGIRVRGNASADYGNVDFIRNNIVSYRVKFDEKQSMLGLNDFARCRSWILLKAYETGVRNLLAFRLAEAINEGNYYVSDCTPVQVYVNEKYAGLYILCEQTQENSQRVDINEAEDGYTGTDIGYLVELDNYASSDGDPFFLLNYDNEEITDVYGTTRVPRKYTYSVKNDLYGDEQLKFIERRFEIYWEIALRAIKYGEFWKMDENYEIVPAADGEFSSAYECINAAINVDSVVDMYMLYEIVNDQDLGGGSFFFAADYGPDPVYPRLTMVAPWDFDWGYSDYKCTPDGGIYAARFKDDYFVQNWGDRSNPWLILFYSADWFRELVKEKWAQRLGAIEAVMDETEQLAVDYSEDFDKDGVHRAAKAKATVDWTRQRVEYLNGVWG